MGKGPGCGERNRARMRDIQERGSENCVGDGTKGGIVDGGRRKERGGREMKARECTQVEREGEREGVGSRERERERRKGSEREGRGERE